MLRIYLQGVKCPPLRISVIGPSLGLGLLGRVSTVILSILFRGPHRDEIGPKWSYKIKWAIIFRLGMGPIILWARILGMVWSVWGQ